MARIHRRTTAEDLSSAAEYSSRAAEQLTLVATEMQKFGIEIGCFERTARHWDAVDFIAMKATHCIHYISDQIRRGEKKRRKKQDEEGIKRQELAHGVKKLAVKKVTKKKPRATKKIAK